MAADRDTINKFPLKDVVARAQTSVLEKEKVPLYFLDVFQHFTLHNVITIIT